MDVVYARCAGLDVHKKSVVACVLVSGGTRGVRKQVKTFGTMTQDLEALSAWLTELRVEQVALESTGVYWWPVFNILEEGGHAVMLVNPQHFRQVPGRKTDVQDSAWLADLLRHGLLRASFIPPVAIRDLRDLTRYRATQVRMRSAEAQRLQKVLEGANLKLANVASDVLGASGRAMLAALAAGEDDPETLAALAKGALRQKLEALQRALEGRVKPHHRRLLDVILAHILFLERTIAQLDQEVATAVLPFAAAMALLDSLPGVGPVAAAAILAEIGADMSRFGSADHLASWAGVCPGNKQSGGRRLSSQSTNGNAWLRGILGEVAWAAIREHGTSFGARYRRICRRQGKQKALVAVMHNLLTIIYAMLRDHTPYQELGPDYYQQGDPEQTKRRLVRQLEHLGYTVSLDTVPAA
jgi:transposase